MHTKTKLFMLGVTLSATVLMNGCTQMKIMIERPFGSAEDVAYGDKLWKELQARGYNGFEIPVYYMIMLFVLATHGGGKWGLDTFLAKRSGGGTC